MPPKGKADLAHPQAADWVMGTLGPAEAVGFQLHLRGCPHCQAAVAEFGQLGQMLQHLPPAAEPPPGLEARVITSVLAAAIAQRAAVAAEDRTPTQVHQIPDGLPAAAEDRTATEIHHAPKASPAAADTSSPTQLAEIPPAPPETRDDERSGGGMAKVIRFPRWHGSARLPAIAGAVAAAAAIIIAAVVILSGLGGGLPAGAITFKLAPKLASYSGASGTATALPDTASGSWDITLTVQHLPPPAGTGFYECWYVGGPGGGQRVSVGTFIVTDTGRGTFPMTSAVDPHDFQTMEITVESPGNGAHGDGSPVVLTGRGRARRLRRPPGRSQHPA
jgi:hypothetical protein